MVWEMKEKIVGFYDKKKNHRWHRFWLQKQLILVLTSFIWQKEFH
jgi:hypothetical protein